MNDTGGDNCPMCNITSDALKQLQKTLNNEGETE